MRFFCCFDCEAETQTNKYLLHYCIVKNLLCAFFSVLTCTKNKMLKRVLQSTPKYAFKNASTNNSIFVATTTHRPYAKKNDVKTNWHNALDDALFQDLERAIKGAASSPYVPATNNNKAPDDLLVNDLKTVLQQAPLQSKMQSVTRQFAKLEEPLELVSKSNNSALEQQIKFEDVGIHFPVPFVSAVQEWMQANPILQQVKNMTAMYRVFLSKSYVLEHCCLNNDEMKITSVDKLRQYSNIVSMVACSDIFVVGLDI